MSVSVRGPGRIDWIDAAKGLSIVLVVFGHVFPPPVGNALRLLRMPLFFFLAGYVFKPRDLSDFLWKRGNSLLAPYFFYIAVLLGTFSALALLSSDLFALDPGGRHYPVLGTLWGGTHATGYFTPYWFLTALFFTLLAFNSLLNLLGPANRWPLVAVVPVIFLAALPFVHRDLPLAVNVVPVALLFVWAGAVYRNLRLPAWVAIPALAVLVAALAVNSKFDMKTTIFQTPWLNFPAALAACHLGALACQRLVAFAWFRVPFLALGRASIVIMLLHQIPNLVLMRLGWPPLAILPVAIALPYLASLAFRRTNWVGHWLLLGEPPARERFGRTIAPAPQSPA